MRIPRKGKGKGGGRGCRRVSGWCVIARLDLDLGVEDWKGGKGWLMGEGWYEDWWERGDAFRDEQ